MWIIACFGSSTDWLPSPAAYSLLYLLTGSPTVLAAPLLAPLLAAPLLAPLLAAPLLAPLLTGLPPGPALSVGGVAPTFVALDFRSLHHPPTY